MNEGAVSPAHSGGSRERLIIGCGYLGIRVASLWKRLGHNVTVLTRSADRAREFEEQGLAAIVGDITSPSTLTRLPAAQTVLFAVGLDRGSGKSQREVFVTGLRNVLERIALSTARFIYVSSTSVYGQSQGEWVDETSICNPLRANGQVCLEAESVVWDYFPNAAELVAGDEPPPRAANVLRLAGIYGPGRLLARLEAIRSGAAITDNPEGYLNLIHVDDAAAAVLACEKRGRPGEIYLVSDDAPLPRIAYYAALAKLAGAPAPTFSGLDPSDAKIGNLNKRCRNRKIHDELQLTLQYPTFEIGLPHAMTVPAAGEELPG